MITIAEKGCSGSLINGKFVTGNLFYPILDNNEEIGQYYPNGCFVVLNKGTNELTRILAKGAASVRFKIPITNMKVEIV